MTAKRSSGTRFSIIIFRGMHFIHSCNSNIIPEKSKSIHMEFMYYCHKCLEKRKISQRCKIFLKIL